MLFLSNRWFVYFTRIEKGEFSNEYDIAEISSSSQTAAVDVDVDSIKRLTNDTPSVRLNSIISMGVDKPPQSPVDPSPSKIIAAAQVCVCLFYANL